VGATAQPRSRTTPGVDLVVLATVAALGLITLVLVFVGGGSVGVAVAPLALFLLGLAVFRVPLRYSLLVLGFLCLTLENPGEVFASNKWSTPLQVLGALLLGHLNVTIPIQALFFSGADLLLLLLAGVWVWRRLTSSQVDLRGNVAIAAPLRSAALLALATIGAMWAFGLVRADADFGKSLWQVKQVIYLPCIFLLYCAGLRGPSDSRALGIALLLAALLRACLAIYVRHLFPSLVEMPHVTTHADSMLFADAFLLALVLFFEHPSGKNLLLLAGALPVLTWGMDANNRRLVWVELGLGLLVLYCITPFTRLKRRIAQALAIAAPIVLLYLALGWNSSSRMFAPVRTIHSLVDSSDPSTRWRDFENYDLALTAKANPLLGTGFGHPYDEVIRLPDISADYELYRHVPHNGVLSSFSYTGLLGFIGIWSIIPLGMFFAARAYRFSTTPRDRSTALTCIGILVAYLVHCYGDMGLGTWTSLFTVAPALALVGKQAVVTGAWPLRNRRGTAAPIAP
jgi:O-Antigen ligase